MSQEIGIAVSMSEADKFINILKSSADRNFLELRRKDITNLIERYGKPTNYYAAGDYVLISFMECRFELTELGVTRRDMSGKVISRERWKTE